MSSTIPSVSAAASGAFAFSGERGALAGLVFRNFLLTIVTLGIYHFWARTYVRAFFWRHLSLVGERFDYIGRGLELLYGAIIGLILVAFIFAGQNLWGLWTASQDFSPALQFVLGSLSTAVLFAFFAFGRLLSWRYLMTRTLWRSVRFHMGEKISHLLPRYIAISLVLLLANVATLMLTYPYWRAWKVGFLINHSFFGSMKAQFTGRPDDLLRQWLPVWLCMIATPIWIVFVLLSMSSVLGGESNISDMADFRSFNWSAHSSSLIIAGGGAFGLLMMAAYFFAKYKGAEMIFFLNHISSGNGGSGDVHLTCDFPRQDFALRLFRNIALVVAGCSLFAFTGVFFPLVFIVFPILWKVFVVLPVFSYVSDHLHVENYQALDESLASGDLSSFVGEGIASNLDADFGF